MKDGYEECERCGTRRPVSSLEQRRCKETDFCERTRAERAAAPLQKKKAHRLLIVEESSP